MDNHQLAVASYSLSHEAEIGGLCRKLNRKLSSKMAGNRESLRLSLRPGWPKMHCWDKLYLDLKNNGSSDRAKQVSRGQNESC